LRRNFVAAAPLKVRLAPQFLRAMIRGAFNEAIILLSFYEVIKFDELVISQLGRHPGESQGPERLEMTGFRVSPE